MVEGHRLEVELGPGPVLQQPLPGDGAVAVGRRSLPARGADQDGGLEGGEPPPDLGQGVAPVVPGAVVAVAVDRHQHLGLDLGEAVDHAGDAELRGAARPDGADAGRGQHGDHGLGHVGQVGDHPVALGHPEPAQPGRGRRHPPAQLGVADRAQLAALVAEQQRRVLVVAAQRQLGVVEGRPREPAGPGHAPLGQGRAGRRPADLEELPDRGPEPVQVVHRPAPQLVVGCEPQPSPVAQPVQVAGDDGALDPLRRRRPHRLDAHQRPPFRAGP